MSFFIHNLNFLIKKLGGNNQAGSKKYNTVTMKSKENNLEKASSLEQIYFDELHKLFQLQHLHTTQSVQLGKEQLLSIW